MSITRINPEDWSAILAIQAEAYSAIAPESLSVLHSKWNCSPQTCFVFRDVDAHPLAYVLAHPWHESTPPSLGISIPGDVRSDKLYLHDLAVSTRARQTGAAGRLVKHLIREAHHLGYRHINLMSIQSSQLFWAKQGFVRNINGYVCETYGSDAVYMSMELNHAEFTAR